MDVRWDPGEWRALVWEGGAALLSPAVPLEQAESLWEAVAADPSLGVFLQTLAAGTGSGLLDLPPFAVVLMEEETAHLAVRGNLTITDPATGDVSEGASVSTWVERQVPRPETLLVQSNAAPSGLLPLREGIVLASGLVVGRSRDRAGSPGILEPAPSSQGWTPPSWLSAAPDLGAHEPDAEERDVEEPADAPSWDSPEGDALSAASPAGDEATLLEPENLPGAGGSHPNRPGGLVPPDAGTATSPVDVGPSAVLHQAGGPAGLAGVPGFAPPAVPPASLGVGDHDGHTVLEDDDDGDLLPGRPPLPTSGVDVPTVLAAFCSGNHANPTHRSACRECGAAVGVRTERIARPSLGRLRVSTGEIYDLTGPIVAGRSPSSAASRGSEMARLLALPHTHVSGNHLEIRLQDWTVLAVDLHSTNGTYLRRQGQPPVRLPETPLPLANGDVLDLGHGVFLYLEDLP